MTNFEQVMEWHQAFNVPVGDGPQQLSTERAALRVALIEEELQEYKDALASQDLVEQADALVDLLYVTYGAMVEHGFPADRLFREVQHSNMTKLDENSDPIIRADGKILKGPLYEPPNLKALLDETTVAR